MPRKFTYLNINDLITRASCKENNTWETCLHFKGHVAWISTYKGEDAFSPYAVYRSHNKYVTSFYFHPNFPGISNYWNEKGEPFSLSKACLDRIFHVVGVHYNENGGLFSDNFYFTFREKIGDLYA